VWTELQAFEDSRLSRMAGSLGEDRVAGEDVEDEARSRALHDIRGGALTALMVEVGLAAGRPGPEELRPMVFLARDHAKIMRNALIDLDPEARAEDEQEQAHGIRTIVEKLHDADYRLHNRSVHISAHSRYDGGISSCCLEISAVDRIIYNLVNNAARFAADERVRLTIEPWPRDSVRFVVANTVTPDQRRWIEANTVTPSELFRAHFTRDGRGLGLANCASFVASAYGHPLGEDAVDEGLVGAALGEDRFLAWFHWPRYHGTA